MALTYVVAHDISDDHRRSRVAAMLQAYGDRIQRSGRLAARHGLPRPGRGSCLAGGGVDD